ncbi:MAG: flagellin lysine-N-methylase [Clostridia bacterium]|nr:flagellin lysine-N-methylase [Clostridia bacterium]
MKLYAPEYYKNFKCIADKCKHSCCIGWEIDVDEHTLDKYNKLDSGYGQTIKNNIAHKDTPHFLLSENDRCPHLNSEGLCKIILEYGDSYLCDICREHPRFYNHTSSGKEVGIGMSCEEACRIILESDNFLNIIEVGNTPDEATEPSQFNSLAQRNIIYGILSDKTLDYKSKLQKVGETYDISLSDISDNEWKNIINSLEYLGKEHRELFLNFSSRATVPIGYEKYAERALAYFVYRHNSEAYNANEFRASLGFCLFCEKLLVSLITLQKNISTDVLFEYARIISEELEYSENNTEAIKFELSF